MKNEYLNEFVDNIPVYASINLNIKLEDDKYTWDELVLPDFALENIYTAPPSIKTKGSCGKQIVKWIARDFAADQTETYRRNTWCISRLALCGDAAKDQ